jgi:hypothetical protein
MRGLSKSWTRFELDSPFVDAFFELLAFHLRSRCFFASSVCGVLNDDDLE